MAAARSLALVLLGIFATLSPLAALAEGPRYRNPSPRLKPLTPEEEARLTPLFLGAPPVLGEDERRAIEAGEVVVRKLNGEGDARRYETLGKVDARPAEIVAFLRDYPMRVGVLPHNEAVRATWEGNLAVVDLTLRVAFQTIRYRMHNLYYGTSAMEFEYVEGDLKDTNGFYKFFPWGDGTKTLAVYNVFTDTGMPLPSFVVDLLTGSSLPDVIRALRKGVELERARKDRPPP